MSSINPLLESPLEPMPPAPSLATEGGEARLQDMQIQMTRAAMCHQYAQMEYDRTVCFMRRGELLEEMELYHRDYEQARVHLEHFHPDKLSDLELDLKAQKLLVFKGHQS